MATPRLWCNCRLLLVMMAGGLAFPAASALQAAELSSPMAVQVSGKISVANRPCPGIFVTLFSDSQKLAIGQTDASGLYRLESLTMQPLLAGQYLLVIHDETMSPLPLPMSSSTSLMFSVTLQPGVNELDLLLEDLPRSQ